MALLYPEQGREGKTERATEKKRRDARKEGKVICSAEVNTAAVLASAPLAFHFIFPFFAQRLTGFLRHWNQLNVTAEWNVRSIQKLFLEGAEIWALGALSIGLVAAAASVVSNIAQTRPFFSTEVLKLKFDRLNPVNGAKQLFSKDSLVKLGLSLLKCSVISWVVWATVQNRMPEMVSLHRLGLNEGIRWFMDLLNLVIVRILALFIFIAALDWIKEKRKFEFGIMMSRREVQDEHKNLEGSPHVKRRIRRKMHELSMSRMMAAVPDASVVITNPTHLAIAVKYDVRTMNTPVVVAKGKRLTALRIRRIAEENGIPILERKPLARAMYSQVEIGHAVPAAFYEAVAGLLAYLYRIGNARVLHQLGRR